MKAKLFLLSFISVYFLSLGQTPQQRLNKIIHKNYDSSNNGFVMDAFEDFFYDDANNDAGKNLEYNYVIWDNSSNTQQIMSKNEYTYYSDGKMESNTYFDFNVNTSTMLPVEKNLYNYNTDGQLVEMIVQTYDVVSLQFVNDEKEVYTYASPTDLLPGILHLYNWNSSSSSWDLNIKALMSYDTNGNIIELLVQQDNSGTLTDMMKYLWTYDNTGRRTQELTQLFVGNVFVNYQKTDFTYTSNANELTYEIIKSEWDGSAWQPANKKIKVQDLTNNTLVSEEYYTWDTATSQWLGSYKGTYTYAGNSVIEEMINWDTNNNVWFAEGIYKNEYVYDNNNNLPVVWPEMIANNEPSIVNQIFDYKTPVFNKYFQKIDEQFVYTRNTINDPWENASKYEYVYNQVTSTEHLPEITGKIYPNPFDSQIVIELEKSSDFELRLTNLQGQKLYKAQHSNAQSIHLEDLPAGIYIYHIITPAGVKRGKIIKQ